MEVSETVEIIDTVDLDDNIEMVDRNNSHFILDIETVEFGRLLKLEHPYCSTKADPPNNSQEQPRVTFGSSHGVTSIDEPTQDAQTVVIFKEEKNKGIRKAHVVEGECSKNETRTGSGVY